MYCLEFRFNKMYFTLAECLLNNAEKVKEGDATMML